MGRSRNLWRAALLSVSLGSFGCQVDGPFTNPATITPVLQTVEEDQNPMWIPLGAPYHPEQNAQLYAQTYAKVFENVIQVLGDYGFDIAEANRYDGRIETAPRTSPGLLLFVRPGSVDFYNRFLSTLQSYRHRVTVVIHPADQGGFFLEVTARKELEDLPRPIKSTVGGAIFRMDNEVERQFEVVDPAFFDPRWIPKGRDVGIERELLRRLRRLM